MYTSKRKRPRTMGRRKNPKYIPYHQASAIAKLEGIESRSQYWKWWETWLPKEMPKFPNKVYAEWSSWNDFLDNDNEFTNKFLHKYRSFPDALVYAHQSGILTSTEWRERDHPPDLPNRPDIVYKDRGFKGWNHFLGKGKMQVAAIIEARQLAEERAKIIPMVLLFTLPIGNPSNQLHVSVHKDIGAAKEWLGKCRWRVVRAYYMDGGFDWRAELVRWGTEYGDGEWLFSNVDEMLFEMPLEWVR